MRNSDTEQTTSDEGSRRDGNDHGAAPSSQVACLIGGAGPQAGRILAVSRMVTVIGSELGADIAVADPSIDARHARIIRDDQGFLIEDLNSNNGTFVDSQQVMRARLRDRGSVALGAIDFTFLSDINDLSIPTATAIVRHAPTAGDQSQREGYLPLLLNALPDERSAPVPRAPQLADPTAAESFAELVKKVLIVLRFLRRYSTLILSALLIGVGVGASSVAFLPPVPAAFSDIKLDPNLKTDPGDFGGVERQRTAFFTHTQMTLRSAKLVESTLKKAGLVHPPEVMSSAIAGRISFEELGYNSGVFSVKYTDSRQQDTPEGTVGFLTRHIQNFIDTEIATALHNLARRSSFSGNVTRT